jgi:hypothetical protein
VIAQAFIEVAKHKLDGRPIDDPELQGCPQCGLCASRFDLTQSFSILPSEQAGDLELREPHSLTVMHKVTCAFVLNHKMMFSSYFILFFVVIAAYQFGAQSKKRRATPDFENLL